MPSLALKLKDLENGLWWLKNESGPIDKIYNLDSLFFNSIRGNVSSNEGVINNMKFKKAELTTKQIVILIILIASFAVILFFLFRLNLGSESEKQLCFNSVMNRANLIKTTNDITSPPIALNCQRSYVCLTEDGSCKKMIDPIKKKVKTKEEVYEALAEELSDCWWMFGEGKVDYMGTQTLPSLYCSICSQIAFDGSVKDLFNSNDEFDKREFYEYMAKTEISGSNGETYLEYLIGTKDIDSLAKAYGGNFGKVDLDSQYYALIGVTPEIDKLSWAALGSLTIVSFFIPGVNVVGAILIATTVATGGYFLAPIIEGLSGQEYIPPSLIKAGSEEFTSLGCEEITTRS